MADLDQAVPITFDRWLAAAAHDPATAGPPPSPAALLAQLGQDDPRFEGIARYLEFSARLETATSAGGGHDADPVDLEDDTEVLDTPAAVQPPTARRGHHVRSLRRAVVELIEEVTELRERNDTLAAALGACHLCWGTDLACTTCLGLGTPGSAPVDPQLFATWVAPAVRGTVEPSAHPPTADPLPSRSHSDPDENATTEPRRNDADQTPATGGEHRS